MLILEEYSIAKCVKVCQMLTLQAVKRFSYIIILTVFASCGLWDDAPGIPHQIVVDEFTLETSDVQGTSSHAVNEVWVYSTTDVVGVFPLPATIPYLQSGDEDLDLRIIPGIKANGIAATRQTYPFYTFEDVEMPFEAGRTDTISLTSTYVDNANVILAEDFESANRFEATSISTADVVRTIDPDLVFEGQASGYIYLSDSLAHVTSTTQEQLYNLPETGQIWMEFNYNCDNMFAVGLEAIGGANAQRTPIIYLNPTDGEWKKMYLDLGPMVWSTPDAYGYEITLDAILDLEDSEGYVLVDNFKIVHYE